MKKKVCSLLLALAMIFSLVACTSSGDQGGTASNSGAGSNPASNEGASGDAQGEKTVLNVGIEADCTDFNPFTFSGTGANLAIFNLYQPMLWPVNGEYYPSILKSYELSEDGLTLTGEMYENITDWQGNHITADDIVFSWSKACEAYPQNNDYVIGYKATGEYSVEFNFSHEPNVDGLDTVARLFVVSQKAFEESEDEMHSTPVGTGAYKLTSYTSGYMFTYEKVEDWWQDVSLASPQEIGNVDVINWYVLTESSQRTIALQQHTIDMCSSVSSEDLPLFDGQDGYWLYNIPSNLSMDLFPNCDASSPCSDLNLRLAICYAINNETILNSVYNGNGTVMHEIGPSWSAGYNQAWDAEDNYYNFDPDTAKDYLAKSSYNGENLVIICQSDANSQGTAQIVQQFLSNVGITATIAPYETSVFNEYIQDPAQWDILVYTRPTSTYWVNAVYTTMAAERYSWGGTINFVDNPEFQEFLTTCYRRATSTEENLEELHEILIENCYAMGLVNPVAYTVLPDWISDVVMSWRNTIIPGGSTLAN